MASGSSLSGLRAKTASALNGETCAKECDDRPATRRAIKEIFSRLDYAQLRPIYCDEGGDEFWAAKRGPCQRLGTKVATAQRAGSPGGTSLYVGAGVAEIPPLLMEALELIGE